MEFIHNINFGSLADTAISLFAAFLLGGLIGLERQYRQRTAGLRTNILVAFGAIKGLFNWLARSENDEYEVWSDDEEREDA